MYRIGEFSKLTKTTIRTLRYYDEIGLLKPNMIDKFTGYRFYETDQLIKLHYIQALRQIGLSIEEIKLILSGSSTKNILEKRKSELLNEAQTIQDQLSRIEFILSGKEEEQFMNYQAIIKELPECIVYSKKMTVKGYDSYFKVIPEIGQKITAKYPDLKCAVPEYCFVVYLDGEYKEKDINIEFCEAITKMQEDFDDIKFKKIDAITGVSIMHKGAYSTLREAYIYAFKWIEENGYVACDNPRESYIDGIWNKKSEAEWLTEIQIPIIKKS